MHQHDEADRLRALVKSVQADIVVNAAAWTAVDRAEDEPEAAFEICITFYLVG